MVILRFVTRFCHSQSESTVTDCRSTATDQEINRPVDSFLFQFQCFSSYQQLEISKNNGPRHTNLSFVIASLQQSFTLQWKIFHLSVLSISFRFF